jgi:hypothetical protein
MKEDIQRQQLEDAKIFEEELRLQQERRALGFTTHFTWFISTKVQILTQKPLRLQQEQRALGFTTQFTGFTSTKVQILTQRECRGQAGDSVYWLY